MSLCLKYQALYILISWTAFKLGQNCPVAFCLFFVHYAFCTMSVDPTNPTVADLDDEPYNSAEDEDFELDAAQDESDLSSEEDESAEPAKKKRKTGKQTSIPEEELDSGDEATIRKARERRNKKRKGKKGKGKQAAEEDDLDLDDEEGGTGGFVRTRAMKLRR